MNVFEEIGKITQEFRPKPLYMRHDQWQANYEIDKLPKVKQPVIVAYNYPSVTHTELPTGIIQRSYPFLIWFLKFSESFDQDTTSTDIAMEEMRDLADRFMIKFKDADILSPGTVIATHNTDAVPRELDSDMVGVSLSFIGLINADIDICADNDGLK